MHGRRPVDEDERATRRDKNRTGDQGTHAGPLWRSLHSSTAPRLASFDTARRLVRRRAMAEVAYHAVAKLTELVDGEPKRVTVGERDIALFRLDGAVYATD